MRKKGFLITFEGIDFSGKSLQACLLLEQLLKAGYKAKFFREPGGTEISEEIREVILNTKHQKMHPYTEVLLYAAARAQIVSEKIIPELQQGTFVICDRYYDSTTAYQGFGRSINLNFIYKLNQFVSQGHKPDVTFLIDLHPEKALARKKESKRNLDRLDRENLDFHLKVRQAYLQISETESERFVVVDGDRPVETIQKEILTSLKSKLQLKIDA